MTQDFKKTVKDGSADEVQKFLDDNKRPPIADLLWCAVVTSDAEIRSLLITKATEKPIKPPKPGKGWQWNDAHAAAISDDVDHIAKAKKRNADFEATTIFGTPLTTAIRLGNFDVVKALLQEDIDKTTAVRVARFQNYTVFSQTFMMRSCTPLGVALRMGNLEMTQLIMESVEPANEDLGHAVFGANPELVELMIDALGKAALENPKLFWSVQDPSILPTLEKHGFDLSELPTDTGTWGGPIWSWWAYYLRGAEPADHVGRFNGLFETGVRGTAAGLADVLDANSQGICSPELAQLFIENGADLSEPVSWETDGWDEENDCQMTTTGSVAEKLLMEGNLATVQYLHEKGAEIRPTRVNPQWRDADEKREWLASLDLLKSLDAPSFPWVDGPTLEEVEQFFVTEYGIFGLKIGMDESELEGWDLERAEMGDQFQMEFGDGLDFVQREYDELNYDVLEKMIAVLTEKFGKPKKRGRKQSWSIPDGNVIVHEEYNDYYSRITVKMIVD